MVKRIDRICVLVRALALVLILGACSHLAIAQAAAPAKSDADRLAALEKASADQAAAIAAAQTSGDNAWMLTSAALVLMMTGPGLALFYGGLVRRKNVLSTMMHSFILMAVVSMLCRLRKNEDILCWFALPVRTELQNGRLCRRSREHNCLASPLGATLMLRRPAEFACGPDCRPPRPW